MEGEFARFGSKTKLTVMIALLTWTFGSLDSIGYLQLHRIFTANMTGNTALLGLALGRGDFPAVSRSALALLGYVLGVAAGVSIADFRSTAPGSRPSALRALIVEGALLLSFVSMWKFVFPAPSTAEIDVLIVISGAVMGMQSAAVRKLKLPGVVTTYITGTITSLVSGLVSWVHPQSGSSQRSASSKEIDWESRLEFQAAVFFAYGLAALTTALLHRQWPMAAIVLPLLPITIVIMSILPLRTAATAEG